MIRTQIALPQPLVLPKIDLKCPDKITKSSKYIACLDKENYKKLVKRDTMQSSRRKTLRKLIEQTRK